MTNAVFVSLVPDLFHQDQIGIVGGVNSFVVLLAAAMGLSLLGYFFTIVRFSFCNKGCFFVETFFWH